MGDLRLATDTVELRLITPRHAQQLFRLARDPDVSRYLQWSPHRTIDDSLAYIKDCHRLWHQRVAFLFGIFEVASDDLIGSIGLSGIDRANARAEVGTWLGTEFQGRGYNLHAKACVFAFGITTLELCRLELISRVDNEPSLKALGRLPGAIDEGVQHLRLRRDEHSFDARMFALTADTYTPSDYPDVTIAAGSFSSPL